MNRSFTGDYNTWKLNDKGELTFQGTVVDVYIYYEHDTINNYRYYGPMSVDENGIGFNSIDKKNSNINTFNFDPNYINSIIISKNFRGICFTYTEGNQQRKIWIVPYEKAKDKDFCKIFPALVDAAKALKLEKAQQKQREMEAQKHQELAATQAQQQQKVMIERGALEKLKKLVKVSTKLKISQMAQILKMSESDLYDHIVDWATDYGFTLDEDVVIFGVGSKDDFIASLDNAFASWDKKTETKEGKLE